MCDANDEKQSKRSFDRPLGFRRSIFRFSNVPKIGMNNQIGSTKQQFHLKQQYTAQKGSLCNFVSEIFVYLVCSCC